MFFRNRWNWLARECWKSLVIPAGDPLKCYEWRFMNHFDQSSESQNSDTNVGVKSKISDILVMNRGLFWQLDWR